MKEMTKLVPVLDWVKELWLQESLPLLEHEIITALGSVAAPVQQLGTQTLQQLRVEIEQRPTVSAAELQASSDAQDFAPQDQVHSAFSRTLRWSRDDQALLINGELFTPEHCRYPSPLLDSVPQLTLNKQGLKQSFLQGYFAERYGDCHDFNAVADFLREWFSSESVMQVQTSGSTGTPKKMQVEKERMCIREGGNNIEGGYISLQWRDEKSAKKIPASNYSPTLSCAVPSSRSSLSIVFGMGT